MSDYCIISTNCIAGFYYRDILKSKYEHPFIWSIIKLSNLLILIKNFNNFNFKNITFEISNGEVNRKDGNKWPKIVLDNKISVYFVHYKENKCLKEPRVNGIDIICPDVKEYAENTWLERCQRIPSNKTFVYVHWDDYVNTDIDLKNFVELAQERQNEIFVLFTPKTEIKSLSKNLIILPITDYYNVSKHAKDLENALKTYEKQIDGGKS